MSDYRRIRFAGGVFFFTVVTYQRRPFLTLPLARSALRKAWLATPILGAHDSG